MPAKDFKGAMKGQRNASPAAARAGRLGVVGEDTANPFREELERASQDLPIQEIEIQNLHDNPFQHLARPTLDEDGLDELASSIRANGFYGALLARHKRGGPNQYELAYGHRRREAARRAGLTHLPVKIIELTDTQMARIMASENFSREDLTPLGEANVVGYLYNSQNMTIEEVAQVIGKKRSWVQLRQTLYEAPQDVKNMVELKHETLSHAGLLKSVGDAGQRSRLIEQVLEDGLTFEGLRSLLNEARESGKAASNSKIDHEITSNRSTTDGENFHNASREKDGEGLLSPERVQRAKALKRLEDATEKFEKLAEKSDYRLLKDEKEYLAEIVERLGAFLDN